MRPDSRRENWVHLPLLIMIIIVKPVQGDHLNPSAPLFSFPITDGCLKSICQVACCKPLFLSYVISVLKHPSQGPGQSVQVSNFFIWNILILDLLDEQPQLIIYILTENEGADQPVQCGFTYLYPGHHDGRLSAPTMPTGHKY